MKVVQKHRWGLLHANMKSQKLQNLHWVSVSFPAFRGLVGMQILPILCLRMKCDSPKCWVFQPLLEDFIIMPLISLSRKQLAPNFSFVYVSLHNSQQSFSYFLHSGYFISPLCLPSACFFCYFHVLLFCIFRSLAFVHVSYIPVLSSFKDTLFVFYDLVIAFLSRIKFIVLGFDLSRLCLGDLFPLHNSQ